MSGTEIRDDFGPYTNLTDAIAEVERSQGRGR
jgi:hypothetical protein